MRAIVKTLVAGVAVATLVASGASAYDHRPPPSPVLRVDGQRQVGWYAGVQWTTGDATYCTRSYGTGVFDFPRALTYSDGQAPAITIRRAAPPASVELHAWRALNRHGYPKGQAEVIPAVTTPVVKTNGAPPSAWKVEFVPPVGATRLYLMLDVRWLEQESCAFPADTDSQWGTWLFSIRRLR